MSSPLIDVLIPVYNNAPTIELALASMAAQTVAAIRILVVDDGSTDETPGLLAGFAARDARVEVLRKANGGIVEALNYGLARCTAEFVARFDGDDITYPHRLAAQLAYLRENPGHVAVGCDVDHIDEKGAPLGGLPRPGSPEGADPRSFPAREPYLIHPYVMMRRAALIDVGCYRPSPNSEDSDLYWRLEERGRLHNLDERLGQYRVHANSISSASVLNGRVMAIGSQMSALSAVRRREGRDELAFRPTDAADLKAAVNLEAMMGLIASRLEANELKHLRLAAGIKLLELAHYRPYEIETQDAAFIRAALAGLDLATPDNRGHIRWHITQTAARLIRKGRPGIALALAPPAYLPRVAARALLG